jgi:hypothetical protein
VIEVAVNGSFLAKANLQGLLGGASHELFGSSSARSVKAASILNRSPTTRPSMRFGRGKRPSGLQEHRSRVFAGLYRRVSGVLDALKILKPETVIRWHRAGFRGYWRWKSRSPGGRPKAPLEVRQLIRDMSIEIAELRGLHHQYCRT